MSRRPPFRDPQLTLSDKRRFERMRVRKQFGKDFLSEIKECVQKTDYLVNPEAATFKRKRPAPKDDTKEQESQIDDNYPHVKFVIQPRIRPQKVPNFSGNFSSPRSAHKTMAPAIEEMEYVKRSEGRLGDRSPSSSANPKDRYDLSNMEDRKILSSSSDEDYTKHVNSMPITNFARKSITQINDDDSDSDSFDDATRFASLNLKKSATINPQKHPKFSPDVHENNNSVTKNKNNKVPLNDKKKSYDSDSDSETMKNIPRKPTWMFSDDGRLIKSSGFPTSNDYHWKTQAQITKISSSSDSEKIAIDKYKSLSKSDENDEKSNDNSSQKHESFFTSSSNEIDKKQIPINPDLNKSSGSEKDKPAIEDDNESDDIDFQQLIDENYHENIFKIEEEEEEHSSQPNNNTNNNNNFHEEEETHQSNSSSSFGKKNSQSPGDNSSPQSKKYVDLISDSDDDFINDPELKRKCTPNQIPVSSNVVEDQVEVSLDGDDVDHDFIFSTSTSEKLTMRTPPRIENIISSSEDSDNEDEKFLVSGDNSSSSETYEVSAITDTREKEIRENKKRDQLIYSGDTQ